MLPGHTFSKKLLSFRCLFVLIFVTYLFSNYITGFEFRGSDQGSVAAPGTTAVRIAVIFCFSKMKKV